MPYYLHLSFMYLPFTLHSCFPHRIYSYSLLHNLPYQGVLFLIHALSIL